MDQPMWPATAAVCLQKDRWSSAGLLLCIFLAAVRSSQAVIFFSTPDPDYNTTAPEGAIADSGWQYQGSWGNFLGTPIAPHFFITARHVGGNVGDSFTLGGIGYVTTARFDDPSSDLTLWEVTGTFNLYAEIYSKTNEPGRALVVFGRGTQRGEPVTVDTAAGPELRGWRWGPGDGRQRWGQNQVESVVDGDDPERFDNETPGRLGELLRVTFDQDGGPNEAHLSVGDSGGGLFIQDGLLWKLAGINLAVEGPYSLTNSGPGFDAAIFDQRRLYVEDKHQWTVISDEPVAEPGAFYATRLAAHLDWIQSIAAPSAQAVPRLQSAPSPEGPYLDEPAAKVDVTAHTITVTTPPADRFYRLRAGAALQFLGVQMVGGNLVFGYYQQWER